MRKLHHQPSLLREVSSNAIPPHCCGVWNHGFLGAPTVGNLIGQIGFGLYLRRQDPGDMQVYDVPVQHVKESHASSSWLTFHAGHSSSEESAHDHLRGRFGDNLLPEEVLKVVLESGDNEHMVNAVEHALDGFGQVKAASPFVSARLRLVHS